MPSRWIVGAILSLLTMLVGPSWGGASGSGAARGDEPVEDLLAAVEVGRAGVEATLVSPETLRVRASNPSQERRRFKLSGVYAAIPKTPGQEAGPRFVRPTGDPPAADLLQRTTQNSVEAQYLLIGAVDGRGGVVGEQIVELEPGRIKEIDLPTLRTKLERFRPAAGTAYSLVRVNDWTRDAELLALAEQVGRYGACRGAAQAALWKLTVGASLKQILMLKPRDVNDAEVVLAEHLLAVARDPRNESPVPPATAFVRVINRSGENGLDLTEELRRVVGQGGLFGLPVELKAVDEARLDTPSAIALALGCQWTIQKAPANANQPHPGYQAQVLLRWWDGRTFEPRRQFDVWLGASPAPAEAVSLVEQGVLRHLLRREAVEPDPGAPNAERRLKLVNAFPYSLHAATLRATGEAADAGATWTLRGLAIGPGRSLEIPFDGPIDRVQVIAVSWGH